MAVVELIYDVKPYSYITSNPTKILSNGEPIYLSDGRYGFGDGITTLSSLPLYGGSGYAFTGLTSQYTRGDGTYATFPTNVSSFTNDSGYITSSALSPYLTIANAALTYQPLDSDLTSWAGVTRASGFDTFATTPSSANLKSLVTDETGTGALVFGTSPTFTTSIITPNVTGVSGNLTLTNANQSSGAVTNFTFTNSTNTGQTASTNIPNFKVTGSTKTWAAGTLATQYFNYFSANTAAFASASTITNSYGLFVEAATAGTNATITNNYAAGFSGNVSIGGKLFVTSTLGSTPEGYDFEVNKSVSGGVDSIVRNTSSGSTSFARTWVRGDGSQQLNVVVYSSGFTPAGLILQNSTALYTGGTSVSNLLIGHYSASREIHFLSGSTTSAIHTMSRGSQTTGAYNSFIWSPLNNTGQTASTEISGYLYNSYSRQWATGNITTQRERWYKTVTYTAVGASVITNAYGAYFEAPTASTNITITNNWSLGTNGNLLSQGSLVSSSPSGGVGYFTGAGSTVTQKISRTTGVTINNVCGSITLVSAAGTATWQSFTVTNSRVTPTDVIIVNQGTGTDLYQIFVTNVAHGSFQITFATTGGTTTEQPIFNFAVIKAVTS